MRVKTLGILAVVLILAAGARAQTYSVLTSLSRYVNGEWPVGPPIIDSSGNVFGTTVDMVGDDTQGSVYELVNNGGGIYTTSTLYTLPVGAPWGGLVMDSSGNLYGADVYNPTFVYELANVGGSYTYSVVDYLSGYQAGMLAFGTLAIDAQGRLYGTTAAGGGGECRAHCGEVFQLTKTKNGWSKKVLHVFHLYSYDGDGSYPVGGITLDGKGNIYGTTEAGGAFGKGSVFELSPPTGGHKVYDEAILHSFRGPKDGCNPTSGVVLDKSGNLYGTTSSCGLHNDGTVYRVQRSGKTVVTNIILQFDGPNGSNPYDYDGHLAVDSTGNVYGTAANGGLYGQGTVFKLAGGTFAHTDLHDFAGNGTDGSYAYGGVSLDSGNLYGTTYYGGQNNQGTVWQITNP